MFKASIENATPDRRKSVEDGREERLGDTMVLSMILDESIHDLRR